LTVSGFDWGLEPEFAGDAETQVTSWLAAGAPVSIPAQAASRDRPLTAIRVRSALKVVAFLRPENRKGKQKNKEADHSTRRVLKSFKNGYDLCQKKTASGYPEAVFGFS
jgi:hypothetical protein